MDSNKVFCGSNGAPMWLEWKDFVGGWIGTSQVCFQYAGEQCWLFRPKKEFLPSIMGTRVSCYKTPYHMDPYSKNLYHMGEYRGFYLHYKGIIMGHSENPYYTPVI